MPQTAQSVILYDKQGKRQGHTDLKDVQERPSVTLIICLPTKSLPKRMVFAPFFGEFADWRVKSGPLFTQLLFTYHWPL